MVGRAVLPVVAAAKSGALAPKAVDTGVGRNCVPGALNTTIEGARASAAELSADGGLVLAEASANLEARN